MPKKKSHLEFENELCNINPDIHLLGEYVRSRDRVEVQCGACGHKWNPVANSLLRGHGCPNCAGILPLTDEQFKKKLGAISPNLEPLSKYQTTASKIEVRCKACDNIWQTTPASLLRGHGCPKCANIQKSINSRQSQQSFEEELRIANPTLKVQGTYQSRKRKILVKCLTCGYCWEAIPANILKGSHCPACAGHVRITQEIFVNRIARNNPYLKILGRYTGDKERVQTKCTLCGHLWNPSAGSLLSGRGCPICAKTGTSFFEKTLYYAIENALGEEAVISRNTTEIGMELDILVPSMRLTFEPGSWYYHKNKLKRDGIKRQRCRDNGITLITVYTDFPDNVPQPFSDNCFCFSQPLGPGEWRAVQAAVSNLLAFVGIDTSCLDWPIIKASAVSGSRRKTTEQFANELMEINPSVILRGHYEGANVQTSFECARCGHRWKTTPDSVLRGHGCAKCAGVLKKKTEAFSDELARNNPNVELIGEYIRADQKVDIRCKNCGHEWSAAPNSLLYGHGCPKCAIETRRKLFSSDTATFVAKLASVNSSITVLGEYINSKTPIEVECQICGNIWSPIPNSLLRNHGCPLCARKRKKN